jgi:DNA-binding SARP family transcriptional activator
MTRPRLRRPPRPRRGVALTLLGGFHARLTSGAALDVPTHKYRALVAYLALPPGRAHPRDKLVALLWGDLARAQGRTRLRQATLALRRALGRWAPAALEVGTDTIALRAGDVTVDAVELERLARATDMATLARVAEVYAGDLLAGLPVHEAAFEEWLAAERARLGDLALDALARLLALQRAAGRLDAAVQTARRLLALDPLHEGAHRALIALYHRLGRRADALRQYQTCLDALARQLGAEPGAETRQVYLDVLRAGTPVATEPAGGRAAAWLETMRTGGLVGRVLERERLRQALERALQGRGSVVVVTGEAGMGKSRLAADLAERATRSGARVLLGQCHETDQIVAFSPWAEALRQVGTARVASLCEGLGPARRHELARLLPDLIPAAIATGGEALPLFEAVTALLERLSTAEPVVLVLEDVHWADEMTVRLLAFLARHLAAWRLLVVATARGEDLDEVPFIRRALETLAGAPGHVALELPPLSRDETAALARTLAPHAGGGLAERVWALSEGHPFTVVEMVRAARGEAGGDGGLPPRVREALAQRLGRLGSRARRLAEVAAVIGREFDVALLAAAADLDPDAVAEGIEELVRRRLVESVGVTFRFLHHRILEAARPATLPRRALLHRRVAEAIEKHYAADLEPHVGALADHYQRAGAWDAAVTHLRSTADLARRRGAYREALVSYQTALAAAAHLPRVPATLEQDIDLRLGMRYALAPLGQLPRIAEDVEPARRLAEGLGDRRRLAWCELFLGEAARWLGDYAGATEASGRARALALELGDRDLVLFSACFLAACHTAQGDHADARPLLEEVVAAVGLDDPRATLLSRPAVAGGSRAWLARLLVLTGEPRRAPALLVDAFRHAEAVGSPHALEVTCAVVGETRLLMGDVPAALAVLERGLALSRRAELQHRRAAIEATTGYALTLAGEAAEGVRLLEAGIARADGQRQLWFQAQRLAWLADAQRRLGDRASAAATAARALALARRLRERDSEALALAVISALSARALPTARGRASSARRTPRR